MHLFRIITTLFVIALTGCVHKIILQNPDGQLIGTASFQYEDNSSGLLSLDRHGEIYRGKWSASKIDESRLIATTYGIGSKKYKDYIRGSANYLKSGKSSLKSDKGNVLECEFMYRGGTTTLHGTCKSGTETFEFMEKPD